MTSLPTFGGAEPSNTNGIYSWDATRIMTIDGSDISLDDREEDEED